MIASILASSGVRQGRSTASASAPGTASASFGAELYAAVGERPGADPAKSAETGQSGAAVLSPSTAASLLDSGQSEFAAWKSEYFRHGISADRRQQVEDNSAAFEALTAKAASSNAFSDPQTFLQSLSPSELSTLQAIHCLAAPIDAAGLSKEGALNLLVCPGHAQDIDNDGFEQVGAAKTWTFPPPNAPAKVKQAWKDATANMSDHDVMLLSGSFLPLSLGNGGNAYISPDADYAEIVSRTIEGAKLSSQYDQPEQQANRARQLTMLERLLNGLQASSV